MRHYPSDEEQKDLNAEKWQLDLLNLNPNYVSWGSFEDYMSNDSRSWDSRVIIPTWNQFHEEWKLDELNEVVNFYFEVYRKNHQCIPCKGTGLNPETKQISDDWYDFKNSGKKWCNKINDNQVDALMKAGRLSEISNFKGYYDNDKKEWKQYINGGLVTVEKPKYPTAEEVNIWSENSIINHDAINRWICVKSKAKELGVYGNCNYCSDGYVYDELTARVGLQLWFIHPRKGCSRGVYVEHIQQNELNEVFNFLKEAKERNHNRFSKIN